MFFLLLPFLLTQAEVVSPPERSYDPGMDVAVLAGEVDTLQAMLTQVTGNQVEDLEAHMSSMFTRVYTIDSILKVLMEPEELIVEEIQPPANVKVEDVRNDVGNQLVLRWNLSPDDSLLDGYVVYRAVEGKQEFKQIQVLPPGADSTNDNNDLLERMIEYGRDEIASLRRNLPRAKRALPKLKQDAAKFPQADSLVPGIKNNLVAIILGHRRNTVRQFELDMETAKRNAERVQIKIDSLRGEITAEQTEVFTEHVNALASGMVDLQSMVQEDLPPGAAELEALAEETSKLRAKIQGTTVYRVQKLEVDLANLEAEIASLESMIANIAFIEEADLEEYAKSRTERMQGLIEDSEGKLLKNRLSYRYKVVAVRGDLQAPSELSAAASPSAQLFHTQRINVLVAMIFFFSLVTFFISQAKRGKNLFLRKIAGLEAIDEAVGRATEMGRPILFVPGLSTIGDIATIAALNILQGIAKKAAQYDTPIIVPNRDPIVYTVAREIVKEAYSDAGRPDAFNPDSVFFITQSQFAYVAAVNGIMLREKPAANFFLGMFWAESLLLAETGNISGAIQIAGTDASAQLPFFITACDYTIIGEELYAASAYLSREPNLVGTIKAQDWGKATIAGLLIVLTVLAMFGIEFAVKLLTTV